VKRRRSDGRQIWSYGRKGWDHPCTGRNPCTEKESLHQNRWFHITWIGGATMPWGRLPMCTGNREGTRDTQLIPIAINTAISIRCLKKWLKHESIPSSSSGEASNIATPYGPCGELGMTRYVLGDSATFERCWVLIVPNNILESDRAPLLACAEPSSGYWLHDLATPSLAGPQIELLGNKIIVWFKCSVFITDWRRTASFTTDNYFILFIYSFFYL